MRLIFIGPQGSGKGTQAKIISEILHVPHISMGELLREVEGELGEKIRTYQNKGVLVPVEIVVQALKQRIEKPDCKKGFILDGFPRNLKQAEELEIEIDKYFEIFISDEEAVKRISGRWNCKECGAIYNINTAPKPLVDGKCNKCNTDLFQRDDDKEGAIRKRLEVYHNETEPILEKYDVIRVNGKQKIESVTHDILEQLDN